jgi:hypothetical protein
LVVVINTAGVSPNRRDERFDKERSAECLRGASKQAGTRSPTPGCIHGTIDVRRVLFLLKLRSHTRVACVGLPGHTTSVALMRSSGSRPSAPHEPAGCVPSSGGGGGGGGASSALPLTSVAASRGSLRLASSSAMAWMVLPVAAGEAFRVSERGWGLRAGWRWRGVGGTSPPHHSATVNIALRGGRVRLGPYIRLRAALRVGGERRADPSPGDGAGEAHPCPSHQPGCRHAVGPPPA